MIILKTVRDWTKSTWTWVISAPLGAAILFWFCALLQTALFGEVSSPTTRNGSWLPLAVVMTALWLLLWIPLGLSTLRDRQHRWIFTKTQLARAETQDAARKEANTRRRIQDTMAGIHAADLAHGDAGVVSYILDVPLEDVLKVTGQPEELEEEPPIPEYDPGPECDDIGGMSEYPPLPDDPA